MPYITREDGTRFVIPSYRDVLSAKKASLLKREIQLLSSNYGEYITLHRKNVDQYEAAFSTDAGYLLGETVWHYFKKPNDLIYCEAIPGTTEAILVIVKAGSVYLDGSFPIESIPDELVVFQTQRGQFEIYIHGDLPISENFEEGKFSLDKSNVKSFTILPSALFPVLPTVKAYQLGLVNAVLTAQGVGVLPTKQIAIVAGLIGVVVLGYIIIVNRPAHQEAPAFMAYVNPLQDYMNLLNSPSPADEMENIVAGIAKLYTAPGWVPDKLSYSNGSLVAHLSSSGIRIQPLSTWAAQNKMDFALTSEGIQVTLPILTRNRISTTNIMPLAEVISRLIDRESYVVHGNTFKVGDIESHDSFNSTDVKISVDNLSLDTLDLVAKQFKALPLILSKADFTIENGRISGNIVLQALGS
ncbi:MAG: hypothetical protein SFW66_04475 [Gammaproteobacteria bacterium]|nr:hypothetical protein [Gammaproteobacteria bacterium]